MLNNVTKLILLTLIGWGIHAVLSMIYSSAFSSTKLLGFRILHALEISIMITLMMLAYFRIVNEPVTVLKALAIVLGTLIVVDMLVLIISPSLREKFDVIHFITAYACISAVIVLTYKF
ncbi:MAG: hypothetical protein M3Q14_04610 [bacterium]|nr:hypothetical protein [bacterium]